MDVESASAKSKQVSSDSRLLPLYAGLEKLYQGTAVGLSLLDRQLQFVRVNQRQADIDGLTIAEHIGKALRDVMPEVADGLEPLYEGVVGTGESVLNREMTWRAPSNPHESHTFLESIRKLICS